MKAFYWFMGIVITSSFLFMGFLGYLLFYPMKTLTVNRAVAITKELKAGDVFYYSVDYCKYTSASATVYRTFHSTDEKVIATFPSVATITVPGCNIATIPLQTDPYTAPGTYYLFVNAEFKVNALRTESVQFKTDDFTVTDK